MTRITLPDYEIYCAVVSALERLGYRVQRVEQMGFGGETAMRRSDGRATLVSWGIDNDADDGMPWGSDFIG